VCGFNWISFFFGTRSSEHNDERMLLKIKPTMRTCVYVREMEQTADAQPLLIISSNLCGQ